MIPPTLSKDHHATPIRQANLNSTKRGHPKPAVQINSRSLAPGAAGITNFAIQAPSHQSHRHSISSALDCCLLHLEAKLPSRHPLANFPTPTRRELTRTRAYRVPFRPGSSPRGLSQCGMACRKVEVSTSERWRLTSPDRSLGGALPPLAWVGPVARTGLLGCVPRFGSRGSPVFWLPNQRRGWWVTPGNGIPDIQKRHGGEFAV